MSNWSYMLCLAATFIFLYIKSRKTGDQSLDSQTARMSWKVIGSATWGYSIGWCPDTKNTTYHPIDPPPFCRGMSLVFTMSDRWVGSKALIPFLGENILQQIDGEQPAKDRIKLAAMKADLWWTIKKTRIRETKHLSTDADRSTDAIGGWTKAKSATKKTFFARRF